MEGAEPAVIEADDSVEVTVSSAKDAFTTMNTPARPENPREQLVEAGKDAMPVAAQRLESPESIEEPSAATMDAVKQARLPSLTGSWGTFEQIQ